MIDAARSLLGRREISLLELPSVARMAAILAERCREGSWVRTLVAGLDRFRAATGRNDLEGLLNQARAQPDLAEKSLVALARAFPGLPDAAIAGLAIGPKVWFRLGGVPVPWRQLPADSSARRLPEEGLADAAQRVLVLAPIGSGLHLAELARLQIGDVGSLDADGRVIPDLEAEPFAVRYQQRRGRTAERLTFLSFPARAAVLDHLERRRRAGEVLGPTSPLVASADGGPVGRATVEHARRRAHAVIHAGNALNVELCRKTGDFFRSWGPPGSRFPGLAGVPPREPAG